MEYEVVSNPNYQPQQEQYTPDGQQYVPNNQPQGGQQGGFQPPPQQGGFQGQQQYQQPPPQQGGQQYQQNPQGQTPQQHYQQNSQQYQQGQQQGNYQGQQRQIFKRASQSGQPVQCGNLVILEGYMNGMNYKQLPRSNRLGFKIVIEVPVYQDNQLQINPQTGQPMTRDISYLCQAWGSIADDLAQWPEGTPVKITGSLNRWSMQDQNTGQIVWYTDVKVSQYNIL